LGALSVYQHETKKLQPAHWFRLQSRHQNHYNHCTKTAWILAHHNFEIESVQSEPHDTQSITDAIADHLPVLE
jgi:hypothetical protein